MRYIHVKNIEKFHPGYKDRELSWAKIHINMVSGDPDCEMVTNEIDWARLIKFILLELRARKPIPLEADYLTKKGFDLKKRPISLTLEMLHNFVVVVEKSTEVRVLEESREEKSRGEERELCNKLKAFENDIQKQWNELASSVPGMSGIKEITGKRRDKIKCRYEQESFRNFEAIITAIKGQPFLLGVNNRGWKVTFDWIIENDTNFIKVLEMRYMDQKAKTPGEIAYEEAMRKAGEQMGVENAVA